MAVTSSVLLLGDAMVTLVASLCSDAGRPDATVSRSYFDRRVDAAKEVGLKVYVVPLEDERGDSGEAGDRDRDFLDGMFGLSFVERIPDGVDTWDEKDAWVDERVDLVTTVRDRLGDRRAFPALAGYDVHPLASDRREVFDLDELHQNGVFVSKFISTIRRV